MSSTSWVLPWVLQSTAIAILGLSFLRWPGIAVPRLRLAWCQMLLPVALLAPWVVAIVVPSAGDLAPVGGVSTSSTVSVLDARSASSPWLAPWLLGSIWMLGSLCRAAWVAAGVRQLRTWRRGATAIHDPVLTRAQVAVPVMASCLSSKGVTQPVTWGLRHPVVLVPTSLEARPEAQREAVYVHELLHVSRRDIRWVWTEEALRMLLWPLPAMWLVVPRLRLAREQVVDAETVQLTRARHAYVEALVWCADCTGSHVASALPFFRRHQLLTRVSSLSREVAMSRPRVVVTSCVLVLTLLSGAAVIAALAPLPGGQTVVTSDRPGSLERVAVLPTLDTPAPRRTFSVAPVWPAHAEPDVRAARFRMHLVVDAAGEVAEARVVAPIGLSGAAAVGPTNRRPLSALRQAAVEAALQWRFEPPSVAPMLIVTDLVVGQDDAIPVAFADERASVGGAVLPPRKIYDVAPTYPEVAQAARVQGVVIVEGTIERTGDVSEVRVLRSIPLLDHAALDAVRQWKYEPREQRLRSVMTINFTLADDGARR